MGLGSKLEHADRFAAYVNELTLPIRFLPTPPRCRVLPGTGVKLRIGRCGNAARDAEQSTEGIW